MSMLVAREKPGYQALSHIQQDS